MSHAFYNAQWQQAMEELAQQIEIENPPVQLNEQGKPVPDKSITWDDAAQHYCTLYLRYISLYRKLEDCYDQMLHPQKRRDLKLLLEVVMARLCQVKAQCVKFGPDGRPSDFLNLENYLLSLRQGPEALEVPVPRYYREQSEQDEHNKKRDVLEKCLEEHGMLGGMDADVGSGYQSFAPKLTKEQAIRIIQKNERGRQGMVRAKLMKELRDEDSMRKKLTAAGSGQAHPTVAATLIQKVFRGHLVRLKVAKQSQEEFVFLGMKSVALNQRQQRQDGNAAAVGGSEAGAAAAAASAAGAGSAAAAAASGKSAPGGGAKYDPLSKELQIRAQRKTRQIDHELKYIESLVELQKSVTETEGPEMKDAMWEERYQWWIAQKEATGKYPENFDQFYRDRGEGDHLVVKKKKKKAAEPTMTPQQKAQLKAQKEKEKAAAEAKANTKQGQKKLEEERKAAMALSLKTLVGPTHLVNHMLECLNKYRDVWCRLDESANYAQTHDEELAKEKLRPLIREKIKKEVDVRLLAYLDNIRLKVAQRAAALKAAKKAKKGKKGKKGADAADAKKPAGEGGAGGAEGANADGSQSATSAGAASAKAATAKKGKKGSTKGKKKKKAKKCCEGEKACAHMPLGDMISLLVKMGILQELRRPLRKVADLQGDLHWLGSDYAQAQTAGGQDVTVDPSMAQLRAVVTETFILPLGSAYVKEQAPLCNALLLYGPHGTGKTLLSKAIAAETNSCWFDLSPRSIERKLGTKAEIAKLVHMVFKVAAELQPSVIYIDDADLVFQSVKSKKNVSDVAKMKQFVLTHKAMLNRQTRVLVVGNSRAPFDAKVDKKDLNKFFGAQSFGKMLFCPCPNYATRVKLWKHFLLESGVNFALLERAPADKFDLHTLAYISEGYSAGNIQQAVQATLPPRRVQKLLETGRPVESAEFIAALSKTNYTYKEDYAAFVKFTEQVTGETERRRLRDLAAAKAIEDKAAADKKAPAKKKPAPKA